MAQAPKQTYSMEELENKYHDITALYDHAEELVATAESQFVQDPEAQLALVEPLVHEIGEGADVLAEEFILLAEQHKGKAGKASKSRIEAALRKIYVAVSDYQQRVNASAGRAKSALKNIADPIVHKIQRQLEQIVTVFLEFVQISLYSIMNKMEVEALRVRNVRIATMMHQQAMGQL